MRRWLWVLTMGLMAWPVLAQDLRPAEPPPEFVAQQYIDSRGCVFRQTPTGDWSAVTGADGQPTCGYPPTLSIRGAGGGPRLPALDPDAGKSRAQLIEQALTEKVIGNLQPGELASDPRPLQPLPDLGPEPHSAAPLDALRAAVQAAPRLRQGMAGDLQPNQRLCRLLGYDGQGGRSGDDPSRGYCDSLPKADLARLSFARPAPLAAKPAAGDAEAGMLAPRTAKGSGTGVSAAPVKAARRAPVPSTAGASVSLPARSRTDTSTPARQTAGGAAGAKGVNLSAGVIPAGARYVQITGLRDAAAAERAAARLIGMGFPVVRGKGTEVKDKAPLLMAGPFASREAIVRALHDIRKAGYGGAVPR